MTLRAMIHHFHGGTSLVSVPEGNNIQQVLDDVWTALNAEEPAEDDLVVNSGQPGDLVSFLRSNSLVRHAVCESEGFSVFCTTKFAVKHVLDRTSIVDGVRIYDPEGRFRPSSDPKVFDPSEGTHLDGSGSEADLKDEMCLCCGNRPAEIFEPNSATDGYCLTCYRTDDRDQT